MKSVNLRLEDDVLDRIDLERGQIPRLRWIRMAIDAQLNDLNRRGTEPIQAGRQKSSTKNGRNPRAETQTTKNGNCEHVRMAFKFGRLMCLDCGAHLKANL